MIDSNLLCGEYDELFVREYLKLMVWYGNILFDIVHNIIENILPKHKNM